MIATVMLTERWARIYDALEAIETSGAAFEDCCIGARRWLNERREKDNGAPADLKADDERRVVIVRYDGRGREITVVVNSDEKAREYRHGYATTIKLTDDWDDEEY